MEKTRRQASLLGLACSTIGLIVGVAVGSSLVLASLAVVLARAGCSQLLVVLSLSPFIVSMLIMAATAARRVGNITHQNKAVEALGGLMVEFAAGCFVTLIALPFLLFLLAHWVAYVVTRNRRWLSQYDLTVFRLLGVGVTRARSSNEEAPSKKPEEGNGA